MGRAARAEYEAKYTADRNYQMLMEIYQRCCRSGQTAATALGRVIGTRMPMTAPAEEKSPPSFKVLGVSVDAVQIPDVIQLMERWIAAPTPACRFIACTGMHGIAESPVRPVVQADTQLSRPGGRGWHAAGVAGPPAWPRNAPSCLWAGADGKFLPRDRAPLSALFLWRQAGGFRSLGQGIEATVWNTHRRNLLSALSAADRGRKGGSRRAGSRPRRRMSSG